MSLKVTKMDVWSGEIQDQPGSLAGVLRKLADANADLEMVVARRQPDRSGAGMVFLAPVKGRKAIALRPCPDPPRGGVQGLTDHESFWPESFARCSPRLPLRRPRA
jgi:hypothetical protein